jgi:hydrogenase nickel incorporation protein HypB
VTEGEDKPLKYPTAFGLAQLVVVTKTDIAQAVGFDEAAFRAHVQQVNPGVDVVLTAARRGEGVGMLLDRALAAGEGAPVHTPVMARQHPSHEHTHTHQHTHAHQDHGTHGGQHTHTHTHTGVHTHTHPDVGTHDHPHTGPHAHAHPDEPLVVTTAPASAAQPRP